MALGSAVKMVPPHASFCFGGSSMYCGMFCCVKFGVVNELLVLLDICGASMIDSAGCLVVIGGLSWLSSLSVNSLALFRF
jgi:hypothetical protein